MNYVYYTEKRKWSFVTDFFHMIRVLRTANPKDDVIMNMEGGIVNCGTVCGSL